MVLNRRIANRVFNMIKESGYTPYDINFLDGYFIFDLGKDSVVHFRVKEVWSGFKFGMWIHSEYATREGRKKAQDEYPESYKHEDDFHVVELFCQHEDWLDKFKPSRSSMRINITVSELVERSNIYIKDMLDMIKRHPIICYNEFCGDHAGFYSGSFLKDFLRCSLSERYRNIKEALLVPVFYRYTKFKLKFAAKANCISSVKLEDFEKENPGWSTDYKYRLLPEFKEGTSDDEINEWYHRWFRKEEYGILDVYSCVVRCGEFRISGDDHPYVLS